MASKEARRWKRRNTLQKLILRETRGGNPYNSVFTRSRLMLKNYPHRHCIPLKEIQNNNVFGRGHILLGFTRSGEYLMSYRVEMVEDSISGIPNHTYSLHWWRFNLMQPLCEVSHISLFAGEKFMEELHIIVCHTQNADQVLIHGYSCVGNDDQARQCFLTISPSPPCVKCFSSGKETLTNHAFVCKGSSAVHMKYNLLPPFPLFIPAVQLKLLDTILINTVDALITVSVHHLNHQKSAAVKSCNQDQQTPQIAVDAPENVTNAEVPLVAGKGNECQEDNTLINGINNHEKILDSVDNRLLIGDKKPIGSHVKFPHLTLFNLKTFCLNYTDEDIDQSSTFDDTSNVDIQVTNLNNSSFKLIGSSQSNSSVIDFPTTCHKLPCVTTQIVYLDVERYINEALNMAEELSEKYWHLRNYSTQIVDICERSHCVIVQVICLLSVQPKITMVTRQRRCSLSCLFSWNISNGEVTTLDVSQLMDPMKKTDKQVFEEGAKGRLNLLQKCSIPCGRVGIQAFSNHTVFTGTSLSMIKHPFQPIAVVL